MADGQTYFLVLLALSVLSNSLFSFHVIIAAPYTYFGTAFIAFGIAVAFWSRSLFLKSKTTLSPHESPTSLVTSGPFKISRNPIYLGMASMLFGVAVLFGTLAAFVFPISFVIIIEILFVRKEEKKLEKIFGKQYLEYKKKVRQWI